MGKTESWIRALPKGIARGVMGGALALGCFGSPAAGVAAVLDTVEWSGNVGYTYRSLFDSTSQDTVSNQLRTSINADTYLGRPWLATLQAGVNFTQDSSEYDNNASSNTTTIVTGDLNLSVMPRSRAPLQLSYRSSDSRVDLLSTVSPLTSLGSREFSSDRLSLRQTYITEAGDRYQARYDTNDWETKGGDRYTDDTIGLELALRRPRHTLMARTSQQNTERSVLQQETTTSLLNIDHFYHPTAALRFDNMLSYYNTEGDSTQILTNSRFTTNTDLAQLSSFVFWRPEGRPLSVSGGIRVYDLSGTTTDTSNPPTPPNSPNLASVGATAGLFYQYTDNLRLDASLEFASNDNDVTRETAAKERVGALYQSDIHDLFSMLTYQWYTSASLQNQDSGDQQIQILSTRLGHDAQRLWMRGPAASIRLSLSQSVDANEQGGDADTSVQRLNHSASLSWDRYHGDGTTFLQMTLSDSRGFGDQDDNQQFANFQALRHQTLDRRSSLSGNLTVQVVRQDFNDQKDSDTVTATGQVDYRNAGVFGVPRLAFLSDFRISRAATDEGIDRAEWENRLDYTIGMLETSASWRYIDLDAEEDFNLVYLQVTRRF